MTFISHRGAAGLAHENSLEAIKKANKLKPTYIEIDIHRSKDGVLILYHGSLKASYMGISLDETYHSIKADNEHVITLDEFINYAPRRPYMLDIKIKTANDELIEAFKKMPAVMRGAFCSPHPKTLQALKQSFPDTKAYISQPYQEGPIRPLDLARQYNFDGICLNKWWVGPIVLRACRISKKQILAYTVDKPITMKLIKKLYPDVTIITNRPDVYRKLFLSKKLLK